MPNITRESRDDSIEQLRTEWHEFKAMFGKYERYLELAIEREESRSRVRRALIEKTLGSLLWAVLTGAALLLWEGGKEWLKNKL